MKYDRPILTKIQEVHSVLIQDNNEIVFVWVPGHVCIRGNSDLMATSQMNSSPCLTWTLGWTNTSWNSGNMSGMNALTINWMRSHYTKINWLSSFRSFKKKKRVCSCPSTYWPLVFDLLLSVERGTPSMHSINELLTLKHVLLQCMDLREVRCTLRLILCEQCLRTHPTVGSCGRRN